MRRAGVVLKKVPDFGKHGSRGAWLTPPKAMGRFFKAFVLRQKRDLFADQEV